jgi:hypothetical protein
MDGFHEQMSGFEQMLTKLLLGQSLRSEEMIQVGALIVLVWVGGGIIIYTMFALAGGQSDSHRKEAEAELTRLAARAKKRPADETTSPMPEDEMPDPVDASKPSASRLSLSLNEFQRSDHNPSVLLKCLERILDDPAEVKFQRFNLASKVFQENVWLKPSAKGVLLALGFKRGDAHAILAAPDEAMPLIDTAVGFLRHMIDQKLAEQERKLGKPKPGGALPNPWGSGGGGGWADVDDMNSFAPSFNGPNSGGSQGGGSRRNGEWGNGTDGWDRVRQRNNRGWSNGGRIGGGAAPAPPPPSSNRRGAFG